MINPIALSIGPLDIRWYSLAYIAGIILGWLYIAAINRRAPIANLTKEALDNLVTWAVIGIILGGRLGYVLIYKPGFYIENPSHILKLWEGGMSFHGGMVGVILAFWLFARKYKIAYLPLMDVIACAAPIGLLFGRIANFINGELWGRVTDSPLGMMFPGAGDLPRHPSQLYQAGMEGLALGLLLFLLLRFTRAKNAPGLLSGVFLIGYAVARMTGELFREPDAQIGFLFGGITMGQLLSLPMLLLGMYLVWRARRLPLSVTVDG